MPSGFYFDSLSLSTKRPGSPQARIAGCYRLDSKSIFPELDGLSHIVGGRDLTQQGSGMSDFYLSCTIIAERLGLGSTNGCRGILP